MIEMLTVIGVGLLLVSCTFPSLISLTVEVVPKSLKSPSLMVAVGSLVIFGSNAVAG